MAEEQQHMDLGYFEERLERIAETYQRHEQLVERVKAAQKSWDERIQEARAEKVRLIESPVPDTSEKRKKLLQGIQKWWQEEQHRIAGKKEEVSDIKTARDEAKERLKALLEDDGNQVDWVDEAKRNGAMPSDPDESDEEAADDALEHVDDGE